jgi:hypothetical protein
MLPKGAYIVDWIRTCAYDFSLCRCSGRNSGAPYRTHTRPRSYNHRVTGGSPHLERRYLLTGWIAVFRFLKLAASQQRFDDVGLAAIEELVRSWSTDRDTELVVKAAVRQTHNPRLRAAAIQQLARDGKETPEAAALIEAADKFFDTVIATCGITQALRLFERGASLREIT